MDSGPPRESARWGRINWCRERGRYKGRERGGVEWRPRISLVAGVWAVGTPLASETQARARKEREGRAGRKES